MNLKYDFFIKDNSIYCIKNNDMHIDCAVHEAMSAMFYARFFRIANCALLRNVKLIYLLVVHKITFGDIFYLYFYGVKLA